MGLKDNFFKTLSKMEGFVGYISVKMTEIYENRALSFKKVTKKVRPLLSQDGSYSDPTGEMVILR